MGLSRRTFVHGLGLLGSTLCRRSDACTLEGGTGGDASPEALRKPTPAALPISLKPGSRHILDADGSPFLLHGDFAASIFAQLTREDATEYLDDRKRRGFNAIAAALMQHHFARNAPANVYGQPPFLTPGDFGNPNQQYFDHVEWILRRSEERGILVLLAPGFLGANGGREGWYRDMLASGPGELRQFGRYLGRRFRDVRNIIWVHAGDFNPPDRSLVIALAEGIGEVDRHSLNTAHCAPETAAIAYWGDQPWLQLNNVYTYGSVARESLRQFVRPGRMPFILAESRFEGEFGGDALLARTQAYQALLCGATGHLFGNNPIWHFDSPNAPFPAKAPWKKALDSPGARSMTHLLNLFADLRWWLLEPDLDNSLLTSDHHADQPRAVAALAADRSFALIYIPSPQTISLRLDALAGRWVAARWYDPAAGTATDATGTPFLASGLHSFIINRCNRAGSGDWVLILHAKS